MTFKGSNSHSREFHDWITKGGHGKFAGITGGSHLMYTLRDGTTYYASFTPSDHRAVKNQKAAVRRILGLKSDSPNAASYSGKRWTGGYDGRATRPGSSWDYPEDVLEMRSLVKSKMAALSNCEMPRDQNCARKLAAEITDLQEQLAKYGVIVDAA